MTSLSSTPEARRIMAVSVLARLPLAMFSIGLLVHAHHLTGSYAAAGVVDGAYAVAVAVGGPLLGQLVDRRGQTAVLLTSSVGSAVVLLVTAVQSSGVSLIALVGLAAALGLATPPLGACLRTFLPDLLSDARAVQGAYALDATAVELTWICGPPLAIGVGALWSTGAALASAGIVLLAGTAAFAAHPASRRWSPQHGGTRVRGGALRSAAMRVLVLMMVAVGVLFGAVQITVAAAVDGLGDTAAAGPLLGAWGVGSLIGGIVTTRLGGGARTAGGLTLVLSALAVGHLALVPSATSVLAMAAVLLVAGAAVAPTYASVYSMVDRAAPAGTTTEAFAWLATAIAIGAAVGAGTAGTIAEYAGPVAGFALAGSAGAVAALTCALRLRLGAATVVAHCAPAH